MSENRYFYKNLFETAPKKGLIQLCRPGMQKLLQAVNPDIHEISTEQLAAIVKSAVDVNYAINDPERRSALLELLDNAGQVENLVSFLAASGQPVEQFDSFSSCVTQNTRLLAKFLKCNLRTDEASQQADNPRWVIPKGMPLRPYQLFDVRAITKTLATKNRVLYHAPTGSGKTHTAMSVVARHMIENGPTKVLWLASSRELVTQAANSFIQAWKNQGDDKAVLYQWQGGTDFHPQHSTDKNIMLVASLQLLSHHKDTIQELAQEGGVSLIVFDEAHQSLATTYKQTTEELMKSGSCKLLGLSATPTRTENSQAAKQLADMYDDSKITMHAPGNQNPIKYLMAEKYLSEYKFIPVAVDLPDIPKPSSNSPEYDRDLLEWLGSNVARNLQIVKQTANLIECEKHKRLLVFAPSVDSACFCAHALQKIHGIRNSYAVTGHTSKDRRNEYLSLFGTKSDVPVVIFNFGVLTTGYDAPHTSAIVVARPTRSSTLYTQMVGRALRGVKSGGTDKATICTITDASLHEFIDIAHQFEAYDKIWNAATR